MKKVITIVLMFFSLMLYAQSNKSAMDQAFREMDEGKLTLIFSDALTGKPINNADVKINQIGDYITNEKGEVYFKIPSKDGYYSVLFSKKGYITSKFEIEITIGTIFFNRFSVSPKMPIDYVRIVLDWGKKPRDIDAHLIKKDNYHISYRNMTVSQDKEAKLDRDDTDSYGPETITINKVDENGEYYFFVHNYSDRNNKNSSSLSHSKACVSVFGKGDKLLKRFVIPQGKKGIYWNVFKIKNGEIVTINDISKSMTF